MVVLNINKKRGYLVPTDSYQAFFKNIFSLKIGEIDLKLLNSMISLHFLNLYVSNVM